MAGEKWLLYARTGPGGTPPSLTRVLEFDSLSPLEVEESTDSLHVGDLTHVIDLLLRLR